MTEQANSAEGRRSVFRRVALGLAIVFAVAVAACALYLGSYYHADVDALTGENDKGVALSVALEDNGKLAVFTPEDAAEFDRGLVFYPGAKVQMEAYGPLAADLAARGWFVVIVKMPFNMAILDTGAATSVMARYPQVKSWYVGGHSMGGAAAAMYASDNAASLEGLVLCAAYSTDDLRDTDLKVVSVYGSNDGVLNSERYQALRGNLPSPGELCIEGGNHAQFGSYGAQKGDGEATITGDEQRSRAADFITENA